MTQLMTSLQDYFDQLDQTGPLGTIRAKSWQKFSALGIPTKKDEAFQYVSLREFGQVEFVAAPSLIPCIADAILPECAHSHLVFIDGHFSPELSDVTHLPEQALIIPLADAMRSHGQFLQNHFNKALQDEQDPFALLNLSMHTGGVFFYLSPKTVLDCPVQCLFVYTADQPCIAAPRIHFVAGKHSKIDVILTSAAQNASAHLLLPTVEIAVEEAAEFSLYNLADSLPSAWHFETVRATVKRNASLRTFSVTKGAKVFRQSYRALLKEDNAFAKLNGLSLLSGQRSSHVHATVEHEAPHTRSSQLFKGALSDHSRLSFEGKIYVHSAAQKTEAYQMNRNVLLNAGPVVNCKPNLEIFADDVKASHGATISQLDLDQLFYLKTRGINDSIARHLLIKGFCEEMLAEIPYASLRTKMQRHIQSFIQEGAE